MQTNIKAKIIASIVGGLGSLIIFILPFLIIISIIVVIIGHFFNTQEVQRNFLEALFFPHVRAETFIDGTEEGYKTYEFIMFSRRQFEHIETEFNHITSENTVSNIEFRKLSPAERRASDKLVREDALLRMRIVFYSLFLHEFSPVGIFKTDDEIWAEIERETLPEAPSQDSSLGDILSFMSVVNDANASLEQNLSRLLSETEEYFTEDTSINEEHTRAWEAAAFPNFYCFTRSFFDMGTEYNEIRFLWNKPYEREDEPFENSFIYAQILENIGVIVSGFDAELISFIWDHLTSTTFIFFTGEFAPPVAHEHLTSITSPFGWRYDPFTGRQNFHNGVDFAWANCFGANVYAVSRGRIIQAHDTGNGYGIAVMIEHDNGWQTLYAHLSQAHVRVGAYVEAGQLIGAIGSTGRSTGPHLHFGLRIGGNWVDPMQLYR